MTDPDDDALLQRDLDILRRGGEDAIELYLDMARRFYVIGGAEYLDGWIDIASPALPDAERRHVLSHLFRAAFATEALTTSITRRCNS